jgi:hypothetical protein
MQEDQVVNGDYCPEHGLVRESLGRLEAGQEAILTMMKDIGKRLEDLRKNNVAGRVDAAVSKTKAGILYWVIMTVVIAGISGFFSYLFVIVRG